MVSPDPQRPQGGTLLNHLGASNLFHILSVVVDVMGWLGGDEML